MRHKDSKRKDSGGKRSGHKDRKLSESYAEDKRFNRNHYYERYLDLQDEFNTWKDTYQDIADFMFPALGKYIKNDYQVNDGSPLWQKILDSTADAALDIMAAGMQSGLTHQSSPWYKLGISDKDLEKYGPVSDWLEDATDITMRVMSRSNFYQGTHTVYYNQGGFGTGCMIMDEDDDTIIRVFPVAVGQAFFDIGADMRINTMYRTIDMRARTVVEAFGEENVSRSTLECAHTDPSHVIKVVQTIEPNDGRHIGMMDRTNMAYRSVYWELDGSDGCENVLSFSGYREFPAMAPRWFVVGADVYGTGPGMKALSDCRMLQEMQSDKLDAVALQVDPPMTVPSGFKNELSVLPGGRNTYDGVTADEIRATLNVNLNVSQLQEVIKNSQEQIQKMFFTDTFLMLSGQFKSGMTATEIAERHEEKLLMLGPVIEREKPEFLEPAVIRTFRIAQRRGLIPPPPEELNGKEFDIEYTSVLAQAQKATRLTSINQFTNYALGVAGTQPSVLDNIDFDEAVRDYGASSGVSPRLLRDPADVDARRKAMLKQQQQQQAIDNMANVAQGAKTMSEVNQGSDNQLDAIQRSLIL